MKKILLSIALMCLISPIAFADSWESVVKTDKAEYLVDMSSIQVANNVVQYCLKYAYEVDGIVKSKMRFESVNCVDKKTYTTFETANFIGGRVEDVDSMSTTKEIVPGSSQEKVIDFVCDYKDYE